MFLFLVLKKIYWFVFRLFVPPVCYSCSEYISEREVLCEVCGSYIYPVAPLYKKVRSYRIGIYAFAKYHGPLRRMILAKKYGKRATFYGLARLMMQQKILPHLEVDYIIPVPLHWTRKMQRGFNQSEILAKELTVFLQANLFNNVKRLRMTRFQSSLSKEERLDNVRSVFKIANGEQLRDKHVLIVDDLYTTGATVLSLAKEVARLKPASIQVVVACR